MEVMKNRNTGTLLILFCIILGQPGIAQELISHKATTANTRGHITTIDKPATNNKPDAVLIVTQNYGVYNPNEVGVWYSNGKWNIFNENRTALPNNASFNILVLDPSKQNTAFVHTATKANTRGHITTLENSFTNGRADVVVFVTQNYGQYNTSPVGVWYSGGKWKIYNEDRKPIPAGAKFNVVVLKEGALPKGWEGITGNAFRHTVNGGNKLKFSTRHVSYMDNASANGKKSSFLFTTQRFQSAYNTSVSGVWYDDPKWTVFNEDRKAIPENVSFNVLSVQPAKSRYLLNTNLIANIRTIKQASNVKQTNWKAETKLHHTGLYVLPYKQLDSSPQHENESPVSTEIEGPNLGLAKDIGSLFSADFDYFVNKLNIFRELYEDKNTRSGYFYYLPKNYNLKWNPETGEYSFYIYYLSANADGRGEVIITAELTPSINSEDIALAETLLSKKLGKEVKLRPLPLKDTPKVSFGNSLNNFDVKDESVSTNVPTDFLEPIIVSWKMDQRVDDLVGAMMNNIGLSGNIEFLPHDDVTEKTITVPVKLKVNDDQTYGKIEYTEASRLLNGFNSAIDYPVLMKELVVLRQRTNKDLYIQKIPLGGYEVEPQTIFSSFTDEEKNKVLNGDMISRIWLDYTIKSCTPCNTKVQSKIMGGTSNSRVKKIEVQVLTPMEYSGANSLKLLIKSKQGDPNGESEVLLPIVTITQDNQTITGGELFVEEGAEPSYDYQIVLIQPDGSTVVSDWIPSKELFIILGENTIKQNFETEETEDETESPESATQPMVEN